MEKTRKFKVGDNILYWKWLSINEGDNYEGKILEILGDDRFLIESYGTKNIIRKKDIID